MAEALVGIEPVMRGAGEQLVLRVLFVGFSGLETTVVRQMVRGLGVLLVAVKGGAILVSWLLPTRYFLHGTVEIDCLIVGVTSILAARYLPNQRSPRRG